MYFSFFFFILPVTLYLMKNADKAAKADFNSPSSPVERDFQIRIDQEGRWYHEGGLIKRIELVKLFANVLSVDENGQHWLRTPAEFGKIEVEDAPFIITALASAGERQERIIMASDNLGRDHTIGLDARLFFKTQAARSAILADGCPYLRLPAGLVAKLSRPVWYELVNLADGENDKGLPGLWSSGIFFALQPQDS
tara:strand:+ start:180 stop:767 length:588 start_codon:yes stop_codon:yes gene_type:complete